MGYRRYLDGMALAIEMAAARIPVLGLDGIVSRLGARLELLRSTDSALDWPILATMLNAFPGAWATGM